MATVHGLYNSLPLAPPWSEVNWPQPQPTDLANTSGQSENPPRRPIKLHDGKQKEMQKKSRGSCGWSEPITAVLTASWSLPIKKMAINRASGAPRGTNPIELTEASLGKLNHMTSELAAASAVCWHAGGGFTRPARRDCPARQRPQHAGPSVVGYLPARAGGRGKSLSGGNNGEALGRASRRTCCCYEMGV